VGPGYNGGGQLTGNAHLCQDPLDNLPRGFWRDPLGYYLKGQATVRKKYKEKWRCFPENAIKKSYRPSTHFQVCLQMFNWLREFVGPRRKSVSYLVPCPVCLNMYQAFGVKFLQSSMVLLNANTKSKRQWKIIFT
jgi:hypothetical protein